MVGGGDGGGSSSNASTMQMSSSDPQLRATSTMQSSFGRSSLSRGGGQSPSRGGQQQGQQQQAGGRSRGRLREFVPIVGPTPGSINIHMLAGGGGVLGGGGSLSRPRTTMGMVGGKSVLGLRGTHGGTKHMPGFPSRRQDRDVNGMCRGRPQRQQQQISSWNRQQQTQIVRHGAHSHGSRGGPRPEPDTLPGVARHAGGAM